MSTSTASPADELETRDARSGSGLAKAALLTGSMVANLGTFPLDAACSSTGSMKEAASSHIIPCGDEASSSVNDGEFVGRAMLDSTSIGCGNVEHVPSHTEHIEVVRMGRLLRRKKSDAYYDALLEKRSSLFVKKHREGLSEAEERRLRYMSWELNSIEEALVGEEMDEFKGLLEDEDELAIDMETFVRSVNRVLGKRDASSRGRDR